MNIRTTLLGAATCAAICLAPAAQARTFVIPHVLEVSGMSFTLPPHTGYLLGDNDQPVSVMLRESPSRASTGLSTYSNDSGTEWRIGSFFDVFTELSLDGGASWAVAGPITLTHSGYLLDGADQPLSAGIAIDEPGVHVFDTEMVSMDLTLPNGVRLRESPTLRSTGQTTVRRNGGGGGAPDTTQADSFFDVFTEVSLDGGQTWIASNGAASLHISSVPVPAAGWLLASGLAGLAGMRRKQSA